MNGESSPYTPRQRQPRSEDRGESGSGWRAPSRRHGASTSSPTNYRDRDSGSSYRRGGREPGSYQRTFTYGSKDPLRQDASRSDGGEHKLPCIIRVDNLPENASVEAVSDLFVQFGGIRHVKLCELSIFPAPDNILTDDAVGTDNGLRSAYVVFASYRGAAAATQSKKAILYGIQPLRWSVDNSAIVEDEEMALSTTLFVGNVPTHVQESNVRLLLGTVATVWDVRRGASRLVHVTAGRSSLVTLDIDAFGRPRNTMHVDVATTGDAQKILDMHAEKPFNLGLGDLTMRCTSPTGDPGLRNDDPETEFLSFKRQLPPSRFLVVKKLSVTASREDLLPIFEEFGEVKEIKMGEYPATRGEISRTDAWRTSDRLPRRRSSAPNLSG